MQIAVFREGKVGPDPVHRDTQKLRVELLELGEQFLVQGQLIRADRAKVLRVEGEDDRLTPEIGERHALVGRARKRELRSLAPRGYGR